MNNINNVNTNTEYKRKIKCEIYRDSMQNYKKFGIRPA